MRLKAVGADVYNVIPQEAMLGSMVWEWLSSDMCREIKKSDLGKFLNRIFLFTAITLPQKRKKIKSGKSGSGEV